MLRKHPEEVSPTNTEKLKHAAKLTTISNYCSKSFQLQEGLLLFMNYSHNLWLFFNERKWLKKYSCNSNCRTQISIPQSNNHLFLVPQTLLQNISMHQEYRSVCREYWNKRDKHEPAYRRNAAILKTVKHQLL